MMCRIARVDILTQSGEQLYCLHPECRLMQIGIAACHEKIMLAQGINSRREAINTLDLCQHLLPALLALKRSDDGMCIENPITGFRCQGLRLSGLVGTAVIIFCLTEFA